MRNKDCEDGCQQSDCHTRINTRVEHLCEKLDAYAWDPSAGEAETRSLEPISQLILPNQWAAGSVIQEDSQCQPLI